MYYIQDYRKRAINTIIPYLIDFPQIVSIIEQSADRYQAIEDVIWRIADNFKVDDARGIFLQALAHNEVTNIIYTDVADDAFTYGTDKPEYQAYGTGHYYSQSSYISGIKKDVTDEKTIRAIKAKIIQNNTNGTIEDLIEGLKLYYNAERVKVYESNPLNVSIMLEGTRLEVSSSGNREIVKNMLPACVALKALYINPLTFDVFKYGEPSYGESRYPVVVGDTTDIYHYNSKALSLTSADKEYITLPSGLKNNTYICIAGEFSKINKNGVLINDTDGTNAFRLLVNKDGNFEIQQVLKNTAKSYPTTMKTELNKRYTIIVANDNGILKLWIYNNLQIQGNILNQDISFITNVIKTIQPLLELKNQPSIGAPMVVNKSTLNETSYSDFIYYALVLGNNTSDTPSQYYTTEFGEKQILFNCYENKNHLKINTNNSLTKDIMVYQPYFNYKYNHSGNRYMYLDGKSGINYNIGDKNISINKMDIKFDVCMPISISTGNILADFVSSEAGNSSISFNEDGQLQIAIPITTTTNGADGETTEITEIITYNSNNALIKPDEYATYFIKIDGSTIKIYKNDILAQEYTYSGIIDNTPNVLRVGYDKDITNPFKGFIKNLSVNIIGIDTQNKEYTEDITLPYTKGLQDINKTYEYTNYGARFITVPQLISNTDKTDLYGNTLINKR